MITTREPHAMTEAERFAEIAGILATGYLRLLVTRDSCENRLADSGHSEAPCGSAATSPNNEKGAA